MKKKSAYKEMIQIHYTRKAVENYKQLQREEKTIHKKNKRMLQENILKEIEEFNLHNETRRFYRMVNKMRKEFKPRISAC
jgi:mRNA-degrading endonuclease RelE of RelBE toxin-antitoxin system